jgi:hypothetical protein
VAISRTSLKEMQRSPYRPQGFALPNKIQFAQELGERDKVSRLVLQCIIGLGEKQ